MLTRMWAGMLESLGCWQGCRQGCWNPQDVGRDADRDPGRDAGFPGILSGMQEGIWAGMLESPGCRQGYCQGSRKGCRQGCGQGCGQGFGQGYGQGCGQGCWNPRHAEDPSTPPPVLNPCGHPQTPPEPPHALWAAGTQRRSRGREHRRGAARLWGGLPGGFGVLGCSTHPSNPCKAPGSRPARTPSPPGGAEAFPCAPPPRSLQL